MALKAAFAKQLGVAPEDIVFTTRRRLSLDEPAKRRLSQPPQRNQSKYTSYREKFCAEVRERSLSFPSEIPMEYQLQLSKPCWTQKTTSRLLEADQCDQFRRLQQGMKIQLKVPEGKDANSLAGKMEKAFTDALAI